MPLQEPEVGPTWDDRAGLPGDSGVLDATDTAGRKNDLIDRVHKLVLRRAIPRVRGMRVLDAGCGNGRIAGWLAARGADVVGIDPSPAMIAAAMSRVACATFLEADVESLPFGDHEFDAVLTVTVLQYLALSPARFSSALRELRRVLRRSGRIVLLEQVHDGGLDRGASRSYYVESLLAAGFERVSVRPARIGYSRVFAHFLAHPWLAAAPFAPHLVRLEAALRHLNLTGGQYAEYVFTGKAP